MELLQFLERQYDLNPQSAVVRALAEALDADGALPDAFGPDDVANALHVILAALDRVEDALSRSGHYPSVWVLTPRHDCNPSPWGRFAGLGQRLRGIMVREFSEIRARCLAASRCGAEGRDAWLSSEWSTCERVRGCGPVEVLLKDQR